LGFNFCDIKLWLSFQKKRKISQFTIGEKVAKKIPKFFFLKIEKKKSAKKKESTGVGHCSKRIQEIRQNTARKIHNNMINLKVQNEFLM
jgi:hypothetical protein